MADPLQTKQLVSASKDTLMAQLLATLKAAMRGGNPQQIQQAIAAFETRADEIHAATQPFAPQLDGKTGDPAAETRNGSGQTSR